MALSLRGCRVANDDIVECMSPSPPSTNRPKLTYPGGNGMNAQAQVVSLKADVESFVRKPRQVLIDGKWVSAKSGKTFAVNDPSTGREIAQVADCGAQDVDAAVAAARRAFD